VSQQPENPRYAAWDVEPPSTTGHSPSPIDPDHFGYRFERGRFRFRLKIFLIFWAVFISLYLGIGFLAAVLVKIFEK
jgi:hypothetical protein